MDTLEATWAHAARIWWSLTWRVVIFGGLAGFLLGLMFAAIGAATGTGDEAIQAWGQIGGMLVSVPVGIWVVKTILNLEFPKFRIVLVPSLESRIERQLGEQAADRQDDTNHGR